MKIRNILISVLACVALGLLSGLFTAPEIKTWFAGVIKPAWNPPNQVFAPVWTALYILMGIAFGLILTTQHRTKPQAIFVFVVQFILNLCWSFIFFKLHRPGWAFGEIILLLLFILVTLVMFFRIYRPAAWLLVPYLLWVIFAATLNGTIWQLNK